jgi:hypothetical protein
VDTEQGKYKKTSIVETICLNNCTIEKFFRIDGDDFANLKTIFIDKDDDYSGFLKQFKEQIEQQKIKVVKFEKVSNLFETLHALKETVVELSQFAKDIRSINHPLKKQQQQQPELEEE